MYVDRHILPKRISEVHLSPMYDKLQIGLRTDKPRETLFLYDGEPVEIQHILQL